jgi:hypothetical protein
MPGDPGVPVVTTLVCFVSHLHARLRVHWAPGIPHALLGRKIHAQLGRSAPRECEVAFDENECATLSAVIVRHRVGAMRRPMTGSSGQSSIPEALMIESRGRGILDRPVKPNDDRS